MTPITIMDTTTGTEGWVSLRSPGQKHYETSVVVRK